MTAGFQPAFPPVPPLPQPDPSDVAHLKWIRDRLIIHHGESPNLDFIVRLNKIINKLETIVRHDEEDRIMRIVGDALEGVLPEAAARQVARLAIQLRDHEQK